MADDFFAPPAFEPQDALVQLKRALRELRPLAERSNCFEIKAQTVILLAVNDAHIDAHIDAQLARRPARSPSWDRFTLASSADQRRFIDEVKKRLASWAHDE